jgi:hypothetical protein
MHTVRQLDKHHTIIANNCLLYLISRLSAESCVLQLIFHSPQAARSVHFATAACSTKSANNIAYFPALALDFCQHFD